MADKTKFRPARRILECLLGVLLLSCAAFAQAGDESPAEVTNQNRSGNLPFSSSIGSDVESVDVVSGNLGVHIPIASVKGRGMDYNFGVRYNSLIWVAGTRYDSQHVPYQVWNIEMRGGLVDTTGVSTLLGWSTNRPRLSWVTNVINDCGAIFNTHTHFKGWGEGWQDQSATIKDGFIYHSPDGGKHLLAIKAGGSSCTGSSGTWEDYEGPDLTGQGIWAKIPGDLGQTPSVFLSNGTQVAWPATSGGMNVNPLSTGNQRLLGDYVDANGNKKSEYPGGQDSLGRVIVSSQDGTNQRFFYVKDASGTQRTYTLNFGTVTLNTAFNVTGSYGTIHDVSGSTNRPVLTSVAMPNGQSYVFTYDPNSYGELTRIDLPTGGYITYTYANFNDLDRTVRYVSSRTVNVGGQSYTWQISRSCLVVNAYCDSMRSTVTDPLGNQSVYDSTEGNITDAKIYAGTATGTPLRHYVMTYAGDDGYADGEGSPNRITSITTTLDDLEVTKKEFDYDSVPYTTNSFRNNDAGTFTYDTSYASRGNVKAIREYDYTTGSFGSPTRSTFNTYWHESNSAYVAPNIVDRMASTSICSNPASCDSASGPFIAQSLFEYDNTSLTATSGAPHMTTRISARRN